ncbi:MAG TPA: sensor domain-containing diguanylate cyclase [Thermoleophilaceae bacterium]
MNRPRLVLFGALVLFAVICGVRFAVSNPNDGIGQLYVLPVAILAVEFGWRGGVAGAMIAFVLWSGWAVIEDVEVTLLGHAIRALTYVFFGWLVGNLAARRQAAEKDSLRWFEMSNLLLCVATVDGYFCRLNPAWEKLLGWSARELMERPYLDFVHPGDVEATLHAAGGLADGASEFVSFENRYRTKDGGWRWLMWSARSDGKQVYAAATDITDRKLLEREREELLRQVEAIARTDGLTGLPNRRAWDEELRQELIRSRRDGHAVTVAVLDIDHFKDYNDEYGHQAGDAFLQEMALSWRRVLRASDFLARYGGEEFGVILRAAGSETGIFEIVERLRAAMPRGQTCSVGFATWDGMESPEDVTGRADAALYRAKREGRDRAFAA